MEDINHSERSPTAFINPHSGALGRLLDEPTRRIVPDKVLTFRVGPGGRDSGAISPSL